MPARRKMKIKNVDHIGIMVENCEKAAAIYKEKLGFTAEEIIYNKDFGCKIAFIKCGDLKIELVEPAKTGTGRNFLNTKGEGLNHICYAVEDIEEAFHEAESAGIARKDGIRTGAEGDRVFFIEAGELCGVLTELTETE